MIRWAFFPKTDPLPKELSQPITIFQNNFEQIDSSRNDTNELRLSSDRVLALVADSFVDAGYKVETGKKRNKKLEFQFFLVTKERYRKHLRWTAGTKKIELF